MPRSYEVVHETEYRYERPADSAWQLAHLRPRVTEHQTVSAHRLEVEPLPSEMDAGTDYFGNPVQRFAVPVAHDRLQVRSVAEVTVVPRPVVAGAPAWERVAQAVAEGDPLRRYELVQYCLESPFIGLLDGALALARPDFTPGRDLLAALQALARRIHDQFQFDPDATHIGTPLSEVLQTRRGVCQDFAHLMISAVRSFGLPARYVSGYLLTQPPPGQARLIGADASHAWVSVWCGDAGWIDLDPTNGKLADQAFITLGWGRDYGDVAPLRGVVWGGGRQLLDVRVTVTPR
ncbi:MAG TPA: transglutaminase family protein [Burkholderiaceae bacterium]|jgi:transglutaminase-like putative cysteine protease|nr:transglutaminase family protein [Burkholderiaceae bacterium]